jgi:hypothetical protein
MIKLQFPNCIKLIFSVLLIICFSCKSDDPAIPPVIESISPAAGVPGMSVTIKGSNFSSVASENLVTFNGTAASVKSASSSELVVEVPAEGTTGEVGVISKGSAVKGQSFRYYEVFVLLNQHGIKNAIKLWRKNKIESISDGTIYASCSSFKVVGNDIYVAGSIFDDAALHYVAAYWKNISAHVLTPDSIGMATAIGVDGNNVYVAGIEANGQKFMGKCWKNGDATVLSENVNGVDGIYGLDVSDGNVYVGGNEVKNGRVVATYWKNAEAVQLSSSEGRNTSLHDLNVFESNVYATGIDIDPDSAKGNLILWKNGASKVLATQSTIFVSGMTVRDGHALVIGRQYTDDPLPLTRIWQEQKAETLNLKDAPTFPRAIWAIDNDLFICGSFFIDNKHIAFYALNDFVVLLPSGEGMSAADIYVR